MKATFIKKLFHAINSGQNNAVENLCRTLVDEERRKGHVHLAEDLERILKQSETGAPSRWRGNKSASLSSLPLNKRDSAPLVQEIPHDQLRHTMVLPNAVEARFHRIEQEFAARTRLASYGLRPRQRILLFGPPGCGKSLGAERLAWTVGLPLKKVRFDSLLSSYFGETLSNLRLIFEDAQRTPCALFLDECDTLARTRTDRNDIGEITRITNALLEFLESSRIEGLIIAATNLDTILDPALFRRFDEVLKVPLPSRTEIERLLKSTLSSIKTSSELNWNDLAHQLDGMSCSEVVQVAQNAARTAILTSRSSVEIKDLLDALKETSDRTSM